MSAPDFELQLAGLAVETASLVPGPVLALAAEHAADLVGVALAASHAPAARKLAALLPAAPRGEGARVWGDARTASVRDAALLNALMGHFHDFDDDETELAMAHVTVTALSAAMAAGEATDASGAQVLAAYVVGAEMAMRIGQFVNPTHYRSGWHASATLGTFGAAAAAGILLGLTPAQMRHALGMAASMAAGIRSNFGSDAKPLQVAQASSNGYFAAQAALNGLTATPGALLGPTGYAALFGQERAAEPILAAFGAPFALAGSGITIKAFPCCTAAHSAVDALLGLMRDERLDAAAILGIECDVDPAVPNILVHARPQNALEAKFSLPFCLSAAAVLGDLDLPAFTDEMLLEPAIARLMPHVRMRADPGLPKGESGISVSARLRVDLADGRRVERFCECPPGSPRRRLGHEALARKFIACATPALGEAPARRAFEALLAMAAAERVADVISLVCPAGRPS